MDSFCGKDCAACAFKDQLACPGCREGMGKPFAGPCEIAACCREKGHEKCGTCGFSAVCSRQALREDIPQRELRRREEERTRQAQLAQQAPILGKWLWPLFWLVVPRELANLMSLDSAAQILPDLGTAGTVIRFICLALHGVFLWQLGAVRKNYRTAALFHFAVTVLNVPAIFLEEGGPPAILLGLVLIAAGLYRDYLTFQTHAQVLDGVDDRLADSWRLLWKLNVGTLLGLFASIFLVMILGFLGLLIMLALALGIVAVCVMELVYLWRTARIFRNYQPPSCLPEPPGI